MKFAAMFSSLMLAASFAAQPAGGDLPAVESDWLTYANQDPGWLCWEGILRATWFNVEDFYSGSAEWELQKVAIWFTHSSELPWDTSQFYTEVWSGDQSGPQQLVDQTLTTALSGTPTIVEYPTLLSPGSDFWVVISTEFSAGGWPSNFCDSGSTQTIPHSFNSDDFVNWNAWEPGGELANYMIQILPVVEALDPLSWAALKKVF